MKSILAATTGFIISGSTVRHQEERNPSMAPTLSAGSASAALSVPLDQAWEVAADFYGLHKWVPSIQTCYEVKPGVRYAEAHPTADGRVTWVNERLVSISPRKHSLTYLIEAGNMGLEDYTATLELSSSDGDVTLVNWSFQMSSSSSRTKEQQEAYLRWGIQNLEKAAAAKRRV